MLREILAFSAIVLVGCGPSTKTILEPTVVAPVADTTLGVGDTFEVRVFGEADLTGVYRVGGEGTITFPLAGPIKVEGLEPQKVAAVIAEKLREGILRNPQVTVLVKDQNSKKIHILGQVTKPGTITYTPSMSVVEAITMSGGFTALAAKNDTTITRSDQGKKTIVRVPVEAIGEGKAKNVYLRPGDIISVPERLF
jgi:protein involved in polysaccharide export with SLBB domain